jgi:hypothetical protein
MVGFLDSKKAGISPAAATWSVCGGGSGWGVVTAGATGVEAGQALGKGAAWSA